MASNINANNIDGTYPIAGQDNDSQGFRTNFTNIKNNFIYAKTEIDDLQAKVVLKSPLSNTVLDNNMSGSVFRAAEIRDIRETRSALGSTNGTITLNHQNAHYYTVTPSGNIDVAFSNWPTSGKLGRIRLEINVVNTAYAVTFPASVSKGILGIAGLDTSTLELTFNEVGDYVFEFTTEDAGTSIHIADLTRPRDYFYSTQITMQFRTPVSTGQAGDVAGMIAIDSSRIYVCTADYDGSTVIWKRTGALSTY